MAQEVEPSLSDRRVGGSIQASKILNPEFLPKA